MAHTNDLNAARRAAEDIKDTFDKATVYAEIAKASAFTDIATALEDLSYNYAKTLEDQ